jgi:hypothetical protein
MLTPSPEMILRRDAAQASLDHFAGKEHCWGTTDCGRLAAWHLRQFAVKPKLHRFGRYRTARGALTALRRVGFQTMAEVMDDLGLRRIAPAEARVADIVSGDGVDPFGAIGIYLGNEVLLGFCEDIPHATTLRRTADTLTAAWSVI